MRLSMVAGVVLSALAYSPVAEACRCLEPDLKQSWHESSDTIGVRILAERVVGYERQYKAKVVRPFSGCHEHGEIVALTTGLDSASCGEVFTIGATYVVAAQDAGLMVAGYPALHVSTCTWSSLYSDLSADDLDFLNSRSVECNGALTCADGAPVTSCLVDPCDSASCADGECEANYCGGSCSAEFYDGSGFAVCEPW